LKKIDFSRLKIPFPPRSVQEFVGHLYCDLSRKIEVNRRINRVLEQMAQALFHHWFVDFGPFQGGEFVESELGPIPVGWEVGKVADLGDIICGKTPSTKVPENYGQDMPFITIPDMHRNIFVIDTTKHLSETGIKTQATKTLPPFSICVSCIATPGLVAITSEPSQTNQQINSVVPADKDTAFYCYYALRGLANKIKSYGSGGSVVNNLNKGQFSNLPILIPPCHVTSAFQIIVSPLMENLLSNEKQSRKLAATRDYLLPRLLSGEVTVPEGEALLAT
jgi:type I restriction enzyme S subunit